MHVPMKTRSKGPGEGHFHMNLYGTCRSPFVQKQKVIVFKNNRLLFSQLFCNLKNSETGYQNANFFLNGLWRLLKKGQPLSSYIQVPPPRAKV